MNVYLYFLKLVAVGVESKLLRYLLLTEQAIPASSNFFSRFVFEPFHLLFQIPKLLVISHISNFNKFIKLLI